MVFLPVGSGRVPNILKQSIASQNMISRQRALTAASVEASTQSRIQLPSDDPSAARQAMTLNNLQSRKQQFLTNLQAGSSALSAASSALQGVSDTIVAAKSIGLTASNLPASDAEWDAHRAEVDEMIDSLISTVNQTYQEQYIFGGQQTNEPPFVRDGNYVRFNGDDKLLQTLSDFDVPFATNVTANGSVGTDSPTGGSGDLDPALLTSNRLSDLNGGRGVARGSISIDNGGGPVIVNLGDSDSVDDVINRINNDPTLGGTVTASVDAGGNALRIVSTAGNLTIRDLDAGTTAFDLGIRTENATTNLLGGDLDPAVNERTTVASLNNGALTPPALGSLRIENGPHSATIDLSAAVTVEDMLNTINSAGVRVRAEINAAGNGINVVNVLSGAGLSITEDTVAGTTASRLGLLTTKESTPLADFNAGGGVDQIPGAGIDFRITDRSGAVHDIDLNDAKTVQDVLDAINASTGGAVTADVNPLGGIRLTDSTGGAGNLIVADSAPSNAALNLGIETDVAGVASNTVLGENTHKAHVAGVFDTLIRMRDALAARDNASLNLATSRLDGDLDRVLSGMGEVGARLDTLDRTMARHEQDLISIQSQTSALVDADLSESITKLLAQQTALQATLSSTSQLLQGSLLDFL